MSHSLQLAPLASQAVRHLRLTSHANVRKALPRRKKSSARRCTSIWYI